MSSLVSLAKSARSGREHQQWRSRSREVVNGVLQAVLKGTEVSSIGVHSVDGVVKGRQLPQQK